MQRVLPDSTVELLGIPRFEIFPLCPLGWHLFPTTGQLTFFRNSTVPRLALSNASGPLNLQHEPGATPTATRVIGHQQLRHLSAQLPACWPPVFWQRWAADWTWFWGGSFYTLATLEKISTLKFLFYFLWLGGSNGVGFNTQTLNVWYIYPH